LDKSTLAQIERGKRMVELLKQDQYVPMTMVEQVAVLFAATQGHIDDIPVESVRKFEQEFLRFMKDRKADVLKELGDKKAIDDDLKAKLIQAIEDFKKGFQA
ncbi:MAG TPA: F0F1 ATP synthase subunit alpha, partial [Thermodesulfovibrionales bacterium]|nr:F0F1 ATP synthase subunit alpha [Thermodesulfovibrionales bacterium]